jgi:hypothetical protein
MAGGGAAPTSTPQGPQAQTGAMAPATQTAINPQAQGGMGFGMGASGFADYNPAASGNSGVFGNGGSAPAPGQMNWQVSDAQKANLLTQQQMRDQMVRQQPAPQQAMPQQRVMSPLMQQQMMRQQPQQQMYNPYQQQMMRQQPQQQMYNPYQQQMMRQQPQQMYNPYQQQGIQQLLAQMMSRYQQPQMQQAPQQMRMQMPAYGQQAGNPLAYRPNMSQAQAALSNVKPSVQKTTMDTMQARIAELEAQLAPRQEAYDNSGGG